MCGLMVCGVEVSVCTGCIMGCVVITGAPVSDRDTGNGICMIPWGMVTIGPGFMMVGMAAALEMCMSMLFCSVRKRGSMSHNVVSTPDAPPAANTPGITLVWAQLILRNLVSIYNQQQLHRATNYPMRKILS